MFLFLYLLLARFQWTISQTKLLIHNYCQMESQFANKTISQRQSFDDLAQLMRATGCPNVDGNQCKNRWFYLTDTYKHTKDYNAKSGFDRKD